MSNPEIARVLRYYRELRNLSVATVSKNLEQFHVSASTKTIYSWENGRTSPNNSVFLLLCSMYEINDLLQAFGLRDPKNAKVELSDEEEVIVIQYRKHPEMHNAIKKLLNMPSQAKN